MKKDIELKLKRLVRDAISNARENMYDEFIDSEDVNSIAIDMMSYDAEIEKLTDDNDISVEQVAVMITTIRGH